MAITDTMIPPGGLAGTAGSSAQGAGQTALTSQIPGYMTSMGNIGTNIASETAGQVPEDVINQLKQQGAEGAVSTGAASNASYLRALGLTSLGLEQTGQTDLQNLESATPGYTVSQNPEFQTSANLQYEEQLQPQVFARQDQQQQLAIQQQQQALAAAKSGLGTAPPTVNFGSPAPGTDALGFPTGTTATLPGQTPAGTSTGSTAYPWASPWGGGALTPQVGVGGVSAWDTGNDPGSAGAITNWNAWNNQPIYSNSGTSAATAAVPWDYSPDNPINAGMTEAELADQQQYAAQGGASAAPTEDYYGGGEGDYSY